MDIDTEVRSAKAIASYGMFQQLAGLSKDFSRNASKGGSMKPQHVKKPHSDKDNTAQAAIPEQIMSHDISERIAKRAYELYLERGCRPGCELEDWIDAEQEILTLSKVEK